MFLMSGMYFKTSISPPVDFEPATPVRTIILNCNDQMKFDKTVIKVKAGEKIKPTLNCTGNFP